MLEITNDPRNATAFQAAVEQLRVTELRKELDFEQIESPQGLATNSVAFGAHVKPDAKKLTSDLGTGRFVLLYETVAPEQWQNNFRVVTFVKSPLETDIGSEAEASDVAWSWLLESLQNSSAEHTNLAGTTTRVISTGHGSMQGQNQHAELEMRASWSPIGDFSNHLKAWQDLVCVISGLALSADVPRIQPRN